MKIFEIVILMLTVAFAGLLLLAYLAYWVNPNDFWLLALIGLAAPILYVVNIVMILYWTLRWKVYLFIPLVAVLFGIGHVSSFFKPELSKHYQHDDKDVFLTLMTYNVEGFLDWSDSIPRSNMPQVIDFVAKANVDVVCFQEFQTTPVILLHDIDSLLAEFPYKRVNYVIGQNERGWGTAIYSRYPIVASGTIPFEHSTNSSMWADIVVKKDTVRIFNNHLQTTQINDEDRRFLDYQNFSADTLKKEKIRNIATKLKINYKLRAAQADSVALRIRETPYPVIVCGDFNDTPMSYTYRTMKGDLVDCFKEKGRGTLYTYRGLFSLLRIDYVFHSPKFATLSYQTPDEAVWSDHTPVITALKIKEAAH